MQIIDPRRVSASALISARWLRPEAASGWAMRLASSGWSERSVRALGVTDVA
jgi:hypothetical protein